MVYQKPKCSLIKLQVVTWYSVETQGLASNGFAESETQGLASLHASDYLQIITSKNTV